MMGVFFLSFLVGLAWLKLFDLPRLSLIGHEALNLVSLLVGGGVLCDLILIVRHGEDANINEIIEIGE